MIGESEVALMLKLLELDKIIIKNKNLFERMMLAGFLSQIWFWRFFVYPAFF